MSYTIPKPTPFGIDIAIEDDPGDREVQVYDEFLKDALATWPNIGTCYEVVYAR